LTKHISPTFTVIDPADKINSQVVNKNCVTEDNALVNVIY
jgi:hypothetical protein